MTTRAIKIDELKPIDETSVQILRVISLHLGQDPSAFVDYKLIARSLNIDRDTVRKAVNRMIRSKILQKENGKLSIRNSVLVEMEGKD
ncbi:MAG TPA: hypothetical protein IAC57_02110 [Candidatus Scatosoma pullistercoris]|uniref:Helix-turn-helix domain-containing protein n=1 Tax=Candidatus Scatosoma pullistercoris TaxID=2840934 RepID=A0A9D1MEU5_9FIRM|nr:hypothetical protein [Candidatus Scatosoma pullistercoris]